MGFWGEESGEDVEPDWAGWGFGVGWVCGWLGVGGNWRDWPVFLLYIVAGD